jgi:hypothetical protein
MPRTFSVKVKKNNPLKKKGGGAACSRRNFMVTLAAGSVGGLACGGYSSSPPNVISKPKKPRVGLARDPDVFGDDDRAKAEVVQSLVHEAVCAVTGKADPAEAWKSLFNDSDRVGIKVNCLPGKKLSTHPEVAHAIVEGLRLAGVPDDRISIWERRETELERAGFRINRSGSGPRVLATDTPGFGYDPTPKESGSIGSCFSSLVSTHCTALVSVPVLKDHDLSGVSVGMKNFFGAIHNPNRYHDNNCDPYIPDVNRHPYIKDKLRLVVCDALLAQCQGGPSHVPQWAWDYAGILAARDPVALDSIGWRVIEDRRREQNLPPLNEVGRHPGYIETAAQNGLGEADPDAIEFMEA